VNKTEITFLFERRRAVSSGILEAAGTTFLLLIAVRWFHADEMSKALVAAGGSIGLMVSPLVVALVTYYQMTISSAASRLAVIGAVSFFVAALFPSLPVFVLSTAIAMACSAAGIPLLTQMYQENYPEKERGRKFARTVMIRILSAAVFSELAGRFLSAYISYFRWLLVVFGLAFVFAAWCLARCPSSLLIQTEGSHPLKAMRYVREDRLFRRTLICWMLLGFANLMMNPLRVEYLANPKYGLVLEISVVALLIGVVPNIARLIMSPVWGWLFDHMNFFALRVVLNLGFIIGIGTFFASSSMTGLVLGSVVYGIANAGGDVAWSLWVTKFAPPDRVADYMSVHTLFTGIRGVIAPVVAFQLVRGMTNAADFAVLGWISGGMILVASLLLLPEIKFGSQGKKTPALVEEISE